VEEEDGIRVEESDPMVDKEDGDDCCSNDCSRSADDEDKEDYFEK